MTLAWRRNVREEGSDSFCFFWRKDDSINALRERGVSGKNIEYLILTGNAGLSDKSIVRIMI